MKRYVYKVISTYAGEQGHIGGGDRREHFVGDSLEEAFAEMRAMIADHRLDYRDADVVVEEEES